MAKLPFEDDLHKLLSEYVIEMGTTEVGSIYKHLRSFKACNRNLVRPKNILRLPGRISHDQISMTGVDLPYWLGEYKTDNTSNKIMVVGIDPLRNEKTFKSYCASFTTELIFGTPFAMHIPQITAKKNNVYSEFIIPLAQTNFVYLTDIYKCYFQIDHKRSSAFLRKETMWDDLLIKEIKLINPTYIVAFGKEVYNRLTGLHLYSQDGKQQVSIIELPHPAARAKTWLPHLQGKKANNDNKVCHMLTEVYNSLNSVTLKR